MSTTVSKSIFSRFFSYITSWFMYIVQAIYSLYKDELERQSRDETDYKKWKLYEEIQRNQPIQQYDEESVLGGSCPSTTQVSIQEEKLNLKKQDETSKIPTVEEEIAKQPQVPVTSSVTEKVVVEKKEESPIIIIKPKVVITEPTPEEKKPKEQDNKPVNTKPIIPIVEETKKINNDNVIQSSPKQVVKETVTASKPIPKPTTSNNNTSVTTPKSTTSTTLEKQQQSKPAEISGLIGERLKMKKFRNFSGNAYNSLIKPTTKEDTSKNKKEVAATVTTTTPVESTQEAIQQSNSQLLQRKLSSKPKKASRRPSQQTIKRSDVLAKLEEEATIDLPDTEKFNELEEFSQLEKKVGLENAIKQMKEKKNTTSAPPPPSLSQVVNVNTNDASPSKAKSSNKLSLDAILSAKNSLRKTTEEWK